MTRPKACWHRLLSGHAGRDQAEKVSAQALERMRLNLLAAMTHKPVPHRTIALRHPSEATSWAASPCSGRCVLSSVVDPTGATAQPRAVT